MSNIKNNFIRMFQAWLQGKDPVIKSVDFLNIVISEYHCNYDEAMDMCKKYLPKDLYDILKKNYIDIETD